jgi:hypothetical protein
VYDEVDFGRVFTGLRWLWPACDRFGRFARFRSYQNLVNKFVQFTCRAAAELLTSERRSCDFAGTTCKRMNGDQRGNFNGMADGFERRRKSVVRCLQHAAGASKPLVYFIIGLLMLLANIGMIHRFACAKDDKIFQDLADAAANEFSHRQNDGKLRLNNDNAAVSETQEPFPADQSGHQMLQSLVPPSISRVDNESMSACLLIKDDNDILNEWLAYHYHAIKLRYLVVAIDPSSAESPNDILARWQNKTDLSILLWSDADFMPTEFVEKGYYKAPHEISGDAKSSQWHEGHEDPQQVIADTMRILNHRHRQVTFLARCLRHLKDVNKKMSMHIDTDEFVVVNPLLRNSTQDNARGLHLRDIRKPSSIFELLQDLKSNSDLQQKIKYPCISMPRLLFGSIEHQGEVYTNSHFNATSFETFRWLRHTSFEDKERNAQPKVIVDVSAVSRKDEMFRKPFSIHRPSRRRCRGVSELKFSQQQHFPIIVNHYTGSWERYNSKNDSRRSRRAYEKKAFVQDGYDSWITPWLDGFIETHGLNLTRELLTDYVRASV